MFLINLFKTAAKVSFDSLIFLVFLSKPAETNVYRNLSTIHIEIRM